MSNRLEVRNKKIQEKRKKTSWKDFLFEICSRHSFAFYKINGNFSRYHESDRVGKVGDYEEQYNLNEEGVDYTSDFFETFSKLRKETPQGYVLKFFGDENCHYSDAVFGAKNAYLCFEVGFDVTNVLYSFLVFTNSHNVISSVVSGDNSDNLYQCLSVGNSHNIYFSKDIHDSSNIWFSSNLIGCEECIFCSGLNNKSFCIDNEQCTKEEYYEKKKNILSKKEQFDDWYQKVSINESSVKFSSDLNNARCSTRIQHGNNVIFGIGGENGSSHIYDSIDVGIGSDNFYAASAAGNNSHHLYCSSQVNTCSYMYYSYHMDNCSYCLGCIGLKNKSYCIFNKQYSKEDWYDEVDKIFTEMENQGTLGDGFPGWINPFYFNDTAAYLIDDSFTKEEVKKAGYLWRDEPVKVDIPEQSKVIKNSDLDQFEGYDTEGNWTIDPEVLKVIIEDEDGNYYRIVKMEYEFLKKHALPIPRTHWLSRLKENFKIK